MSWVQWIYLIRARFLRGWFCSVSALGVKWTIDCPFIFERFLVRFSINNQLPIIRWHGFCSWVYKVFLFWWWTKEFSTNWFVLIINLRIWGLVRNRCQDAIITRSKLVVPYLCWNIILIIILRNLSRSPFLFSLIISIPLIYDTVSSTHLTKKIFGLTRFINLPQVFNNVRPCH